MKWFLQKPDKTVYGPVDIDVLKSWAADGRVLPEDVTSTDKTHWRPAHELAALEMNWQVELNDGRLLGPIHLTVLLELVAEGTVLPGARLRNTRNDGEIAPGEARHWRQMYEEEVGKMERRLIEQEKIFQDRIHFLEEELPRERAAAEEARKRMVEMEDQHREILRQLRDLSDRYIRLRGQAQGAPVKP